VVPGPRPPGQVGKKTAGGGSRLLIVGVGRVGLEPTTKGL